MRGGVRTSCLRYLLLAALAGSAPAHAHLVGGGHGEFSWWQVDPLALVLLLVTGWWYWRGMRHMQARPQATPDALRRRRQYFWWGWGLLFLALATPLDPLGEELFSVHMLQHEVMMLGAAPLLVLSRPSSALLRGCPQGLARAFGRLTSAGQGLWPMLTAPLAAWTIHLVGLWGWHIPALFSAGLTNTWIHALQHTSFLLIGLVFWWSLRHAMSGALAYLGVLYLFTTAVHASILGALLTFSQRVWYAPYLETAPDWGLSALEDQQLGGLIMWMPAGVVFILAALLMLARSLQQPRTGVNDDT